MVWRLVRANDSLTVQDQPSLPLPAKYQLSYAVASDHDPWLCDRLVPYAALSNFFSNSDEFRNENFARIYRNAWKRLRKEIFIQSPFNSMGTKQKSTLAAVSVIRAMKLRSGLSLLRQRTIRELKDIIESAENAIGVDEGLWLLVGTFQPAPRCLRGY